MKLQNCLLLSLLFFSQTVVYAADKTPIKIYLDSDRSRHYESAWSIELGLRSALKAVNNQIQGHPIELVLKDHRGNAKRSKKHMAEFKDDKDALFIMGGLHSPPLIKYRQYINDNKILILVPWAAGGPITRHPDSENWVFRLSVDDTKAGYRLANFAAKNLQCKKPHLLLEKTPWGESNYKSMLDAFQKLKRETPNVSWFGWNTQTDKAQRIIHDVLNQQGDCVLLVANALEGEVFVKTIREHAKHLPIISHWGITGGKFHEKVPHPEREKLELFFIQSCFDFIENQSKEKQKAFEAVQTLYPNDITTPYDIPAISGFIHSYDLTKLFLQAVSQITLSDNMLENRNQLRIALENINQPVVGLVKTYVTPFSMYSENNTDAHEALGLSDLCMGQFGSKNEVRIISN